MSSMSNVAGLSKWIRTLPNAKSSVLMIIILSFITGVLLFLLQPVSVGNGLEDFFYGGAFGFVVFGLPAIIVGSTDQLWVESLNGINLKAKHSMFLALVSMSLAGIVSITTRIKLFNSFLIAIIQPLLMIGMLIITSFLNNIEDIFALGYISTFFKVIIASVIFLIAIYAFISVVESPMKKNLGFGAMEILSYFILHMNEGTNTIEQ